MLAEQYVEAASGMRKAMDQLLARTAKTTVCVHCEAVFYFLDESGFAAHVNKMCLACSVSRKEAQHGMVVSPGQAAAMRARRSAQMRVASRLVSHIEPDHGAILEMIEGFESDPRFNAVLAQLEPLVSDWEARWMAAVTIQTVGWLKAVEIDPVVGDLVRHMDPKRILRVVASATAEHLAEAELSFDPGLLSNGRVTIYDGPMSPKDHELIRTLRSAELKLGRNLRLVCHHADGTKSTHRGDRAPMRST